jgi:hypothetical protein
LAGFLRKHLWLDRRLSSTGPRNRETGETQPRSLIERSRHIISGTVGDPAAYYAFPDQLPTTGIHNVNADRTFLILGYGGSLSMHRPWAVETTAVVERAAMPIHWLRSRVHPHPVIEISAEIDEQLRRLRIIAEAPYLHFTGCRLS